MADITTSVKEANIERHDVGLGTWVAKLITPVSDSVAATGTHEVITLPANCFVAGGWVVVKTKLTSTSNNGTMQFKVGSATLGAAFTADGTELDAKDVIRLGANDFDGTAGSSLYVTTADTIDMVVATNAITAGAFYLIVNIVELIDE